jgi:L-ascorbate metabolism protein UlaG (beta-lactamase superfamily)
MPVFRDLDQCTLLRRAFCLACLAGCFSLLSPSGSRAEVATTATTLIDPQLSAPQNAYLDQQASSALQLITTTLRQYPPQLPEPAERKLALCLLDAILHETQAARRAPCRGFLADRLAQAVHAIEGTRVTSGARVWKLYNHGFVVRTPTVTIAFDLIRTPPYLRAAARTEPDAVDRLVAQCDVLLISHQHDDHADPYLAQAFLDAGKPVVAPPDLWPGQPIYKQITHLARDEHAVQQLALGRGKPALAVVVFPGHQQISERGTVLNNVSLVKTPEGIGICHTGDQSWLDDFAWIDSAGARQRVDILLPNCWTADLPRMIRGMRPRVVIPGHENEMGHDLATRIPFWRGYAAAQGAASPVVMLTWGESYPYAPKANAR